MAEQNVKESVQEENQQQPVETFDTGIYKMMAYQFYVGVCDGYEAATEKLEAFSELGGDVNSKRIAELKKDQKTYYNIKDYIDQILISKGLSDLDLMKSQQKADKAANKAAKSQKSINRSMTVESHNSKVASHNRKIKKAEKAQAKANKQKNAQAKAIGEIVLGILENKQQNKGIEEIKGVLKQELYPKIKDIHDTTKKKQKAPLIAGIVLILVGLIFLLLLTSLGLIAIIIGAVAIWYKSRMKRKMIQNINQEVYDWTSTYLFRDNE